ncbi:hypothetical protein CI238_01577, partial [Colletotrichum incanum]
LTSRIKPFPPNSPKLGPPSKPFASSSGSCWSTRASQDSGFLHFGKEQLKLALLKVACPPVHGSPLLRRRQLFLPHPSVPSFLQLPGTSRTPLPPYLSSPQTSPENQQSVPSNSLHKAHLTYARRRRAEGVLPPSSDRTWTSKTIHHSLLATAASRGPAAAATATERAYV